MLTKMYERNIFVGATIKLVIVLLLNFLACILIKKIILKSYNWNVYKSFKINWTLYKLNRFLHETIVNTIYIYLIQPYLYGIEAWLITLQFDEEIDSNLMVNNQIPSRNTRSDNQMSILRVNRSKAKYCVRHNCMIDNMEFLT